MAAPDQKSEASEAPRVERPKEVSQKDLRVVLRVVDPDGHIDSAESFKERTKNGGRCLRRLFSKRFVHQVMLQRPTSVGKSLLQETSVA